MNQLRDKLLALFALKRGKFESANRKSLDRFLQRTEFQRRRQSFFEAACAYGKKKSRVTMCKRGKRPGFAVELKTQTTKQLRQTIADFMKQLGIHDIPKLMKKNNKQLESLAKKNHWDAVLFLSDTSLEKPDEAEEKKGGMMKKEKKSPVRHISPALRPPELLRLEQEIGHAGRPVDLTVEEQREHLQEQRRHRRRKQSIHPRLRRTGTQPVGLRLREPMKAQKGPQKGTKKRKLQVPQITGRDATGSIIEEQHGVTYPLGRFQVEPTEYDSPSEEGRLVNDPADQIPEMEFAIPRPLEHRVQRERSPPRMHPHEEHHDVPVVPRDENFPRRLFEAEQRHFEPSEGAPRERAVPVLRTEQKQRGAVVPRRASKTQTAVLPKIIPNITQPVKTGVDEPDLPRDDEDEKRGLPKPEKEDSSDERRECYALSDDEDVCACEPDPLTSVRLSKTQRKELNRLNALRKLNCAKLNLLKCTLDLKKYQTRVWEADRLNTNGDYLASFGKNPARRLNKIKQVTDPEDRDFLKAVLANQNATMRLKKGKEHLERRIGNKKGKLGKDFTLASMRHDQVLDEKAKNNDI